MRAPLAPKASQIAMESASTHTLMILMMMMMMIFIISHRMIWLWNHAQTLRLIEYVGVDLAQPRAFGPGGQRVISKYSVPKYTVPNYSVPKFSVHKYSVLNFQSTSVPKYSVHVEPSPKTQRTTDDFFMAFSSTEKAYKPWSNAGLKLYNYSTSISKKV